MNRTFGIAAGAGLASALLFAASAKGAGPALVIAYVTPLPIMIAALGFGQATGLMAAGIASCAIAGVLGLLPGVFFGILLGFPSWWLAYLVLLARPVIIHAQGIGPDLSAPMLWYPIGRIVVWGAGLVAAVVLALGSATVVHFGSYVSAVHALSSRLATILGGSPSDGLPIGESAAAIVQLLPSLMAGSAFLMLMVNLWLAARVVQRSGLLSRPWPPLPENLRLPRIAAACLIGCGLIATAGGATSVASGVIVAPLSVAFMLQGLGAAHALTRGLAARRLILFAIYFITLSVIPSLLALAVLGVIDCLLPLRQKHRPSTPSPTKT